MEKTEKKEKDEPHELGFVDKCEMLLHGEDGEGGERGRRKNPMNWVL
jgi:hypothetical protein